MRRKNKYNFEIDLDEVLLDSSNLPAFNKQQFEGRIERALSKKAILALSLSFVLVGGGYLYRLGTLQIAQGSEFRLRSEDNSLRLVTIPTERGVIYDREGKLLARNDPDSGRTYTDLPGLSHIVGYLGLPSEEELDGLPHRDPNIRIGKMGVEKEYDEKLRGNIGEKIEEVDSTGDVVSESISRVPSDGSPVNLSIDAAVQSALYKYIEAVSLERDFTGGAGVIIDIDNGEILALSSYPEFPLSALSGTSTGPELPALLLDKRNPFLNRAISGTYAPGSIIKPFMAVAALEEGIINENRQILSTGSLQIPNPYSPGTFAVFKDWKAHGLVDMRHALAVSSNVYFYEIGGGYKDQKGLGIEKIDQYSFMFGFGRETGVNLPGEAAGVVPSPAWKDEIFNEGWRLGDTYHTAIGQYGFQVTPLQMARAVAAIANGGNLLRPSVVKIGLPKDAESLPLDPGHLEIVQEGMRLATLEGTALALNVPYVEIAAKTGTAELGDTKQRVNSWIEGYFPYENPRYAFAIVMERGHVGNTIGAAYVARQFFDWLNIYAPEYLEGN
ncbi:MAG TPA: penicillin-binding transpeptidase domain-containing protein [Candidatus Paceibacterota bacterium]